MNTCGYSYFIDSNTSLPRCKPPGLPKAPEAAAGWQSLERRPVEGTKLLRRNKTGSDPDFRVPRSIYSTPRAVGHAAGRTIAVPSATIPQQVAWPF